MDRATFLPDWVRVVGHLEGLLPRKVCGILEEKAVRKEPRKPMHQGPRNQYYVGVVALGYVAS